MTAATQGRLLEGPAVGVPPVAGKALGPWTAPNAAVGVVVVVPVVAAGVGVGVGVAVCVGVGMGVGVGVGVGLPTITSMCEISWQVELGVPVRCTVTTDVPIPVMP